MKEPTAFSEALGGRLRQRRQELCLSLGDVCARTEISKAHLWAIERGTTSVGANLVYRLALLYDVSCDWLMARETTILP